MRASVGTYTLGQSVLENSALLFFYKRILGCSFCLRVAPHNGRGEWSQHYMCCRSVYSAVCIFFFPGDAQGISLVHMFMALYMPVATFALTS